MAEDKFYEVEDSEGKYMEVILEDADRNEYIYWYDLSKLPDGEDEWDFVIEVAKKFHASKDLPQIPEDDEDSDEPYAGACEPFPRYASEFTFIV